MSNVIQFNLRLSLFKDLHEQYHDLLPTIKRLTLLDSFEPMVIRRLFVNTFVAGWDESQGYLSAAYQAFNQIRMAYMQVLSNNVYPWIGNENYIYNERLAAVERALFVYLNIEGFSDTETAEVIMQGLPLTYSRVEEWSEYINTIIDELVNKCSEWYLIDGELHFHIEA